MFSDSCQLRKKDIIFGAAQTNIEPSYFVIRALQIFLLLNRRNFGLSVVSMDGLE